MFSTKNFDYECTSKCRCTTHGRAITAALTKRSISDQQLAAFLVKTCCNYYNVVDDLGRSALHMASSVDRYAIVELLLNSGAVVNKQDLESRSSALHRALYYGCIDCAVLLVRHGASLDLLDTDNRTPIQNICRMPVICEDNQTSSNEILVWGSNKNYNLGIDGECAHTPQYLDYFRKEQISVDAVALGPYHSLFLDRKGNLYAVGHGKGGRLGINKENSLAAPKKIKVPIKNEGEAVVCISVSLKHSLLLTNRSAVFACGLNEDQQLGVYGAGGKLAVFKEVVSLRDHKVENLLGVIARDNHSLAYSDQYVYVWGTNNGQWGLGDTIKTIPLPKLLKIQQDMFINLVEANNFSIVVVTNQNNNTIKSQNHIFLYYNYKIKYLKWPNYEDIKSVCVFGGDSVKTTKGNATALKLLLLMETNVVFLWYENTQQFYRCFFSHIRISTIDKIFYKANQVVILSNGDIYTGKCQQFKQPEFQRSKAIWFSKYKERSCVSTDYIVGIELQQLQNVDRVVDISCDTNFSSFAVLQDSHNKYFSLPTLMAEEYSFTKLYNDVHESDAVHDIVFHVDGETYAAHKFFIYSRAPGLRKIISAYVDKDICLNFDQLTGKMFELMLKHIYTNYLPNVTDFDDIEQSMGRKETEDTFQICQLFLQFVEKFEITNLAKYLKSCLQTSPFEVPNVPNKSKYRFNRLRRKDFPELCDVRMICGDEVELLAHKCMLVARMEYFEMMFTHTWAEQTTVNMSTVPVEYMEPILDFLYSSDVEKFRKQKFSETYLYNMIVFCDQFFIDRLRKVCEILLLNKISIRKCGELLHFACTYNCSIMKRGCMDYICQNLSRVLRNKSLDNCEPETLNCLNAHYRQMFKSDFDYRIITPDAEAIDDDLLVSFVDDFEVDLQYYREHEEEILEKRALKTTSTSKHKITARQYELDAISSMKESLNLEENIQSPTAELPKFVTESRNVASKLQEEAKIWTKVVDKKDRKKSPAIENFAKVNEKLKREEKADAEVQVLNEVKTPEMNIEQSASFTPSKAYNVNLFEFTPTREKLSQKQRKRLSSTEMVWPVPPPADQVTVSTPNAWGRASQSPSTSLSFNDASPLTGSSADPTSFANMMRGNSLSPSTSTGVAAAPTGANQDSFTKIIAEERKQRAYYERMRNKSLALTQIEETAISELREFYNVDNIGDEVITIERLAMPITMNFSTWQHH